MTTDSATLYFGAAVQLAGVNRFYTRRVMQRCARGEITLSAAAELLIACAKHGEATIEIIGVQTTVT